MNMIFTRGIMAFAISPLHTVSKVMPLLAFWTLEHSPEWFKQSARVTFLIGVSSFMLLSKEEA